MTDLGLAPTALHRDVGALPIVDLGDGTELQLVQVDLAAGVWVVRNRFAPGTTIQKHKHTGHVHAFTVSGAWHYLESPREVSTAGSYLFEPAASVHTLHVPADNDEVTEVWFTIHGANLNLDENDRVDLVVDAPGILALYRLLCADQHDHPDPAVVIVGAPGEPA